MNSIWPWVTLAGLGAFHGLNPAMGWLFAVALGLHRNDRRVVWLALLPITLGHALSIALFAAAIVSVGVTLDLRGVSIAAGLVLIAWALYHWRFGSRHRVRIGLRTGLVGLGLWSFLMATGHGAGLMLWPVLMPLCFPGAGTTGVGSPFVMALFAVGLHTLAMLAATAAVALAVYEWVGLEILKRAWINVDLIWILAIIVAGTMLLVS